MTFESSGWCFPFFPCSPCYPCSPNLLHDLPSGMAGFNNFCSPDHDCIVDGWSSSSWLHCTRMMVIIIMMTASCMDDDLNHDHCIVHKWGFWSSYWLHRIGMMILIIMWWLHRTWMMMIIILMIAPYTDDHHHHHDCTVYRWWSSSLWWMHGTLTLYIDYIWCGWSFVTSTDEQGDSRS